MHQAMSLQMLLKREHLPVLVGLVGITGLAWIYLAYLAWGMASMGGTMNDGGMNMDMAMPQMQAWGVLELGLGFVMWTVMMTAMMLPSASPMILLFANVSRTRRAQRRPHVPTFVFLGGYLADWTGFSALAVLAQGGLHTAALLSPMLVSTSPLLGGALLIAAGIYQWTRLKHACLSQCRSPLAFLLSEWREGAWGAFQMGLKHGSYCVGCCWLLMALLFVAGVMNLAWITVVAGFALIEKLAPAGVWIGRAASVPLVAAGVWMGIRSFF